MRIWVCEWPHSIEARVEEDRQVIIDHAVFNGANYPDEFTLTEDYISVKGMLVARLLEVESSSGEF